MELTLPHDEHFENKSQKSFYTNDEQALLYKLENGLVNTKTHDQVMENLRKKLGLSEK